MNSLLDLIPPCYQEVVRVPDTKNPGYIAVTSLGIKCYIKVFTSSVAAEAELAVLNYLHSWLANFSDRHQRELLFNVPAIYEHISEAQFDIVVLQYIDGFTGRDLLLKGKSNHPELCKKMILAVAQIHSVVASDLSNLFPQIVEPRFSRDSDCFDRLQHLLATEGALIFDERVLQDVKCLLIPYFEIILDLTKDFPTDYYKDANPANWLFPNNANSIYACDFEGRRRTPFFIDLINIMEYASPYLKENSKSNLLELYLQEREKWTPSLVNDLRHFDLRVLWNVWGIFRHQEQMLHRVRDIGCSNNNIDWHRSAFSYHLRMVLSHLQLMLNSPCLSIPHKRILESNITQIAKIYEENFQLHLCHFEHTPWI